MDGTSPLQPGGEHLKAMVLRRMDTIDQLALAGIRGLTIINGGALIALFTLMSQGSQSAFAKHMNPGAVAWAGAAFVAGLFAIMFANWLGFAAQQMFHFYEQAGLHQHLMATIGQPAPEANRKLANGGNRVLTAAALFGLLSLISFATGCGIVLHAVMIGR